MSQPMEPTAILTQHQMMVTPMQMQPPSGSFLFNHISLTGSGRLNFTGFWCFLLGAVAIGCEGGILSKVGPESSFLSATLFADFFGNRLFALGVVVMLVCRLQVYVLPAVFILSFYELIDLIRRIVWYSVILANWNDGHDNFKLTPTDLSTIKYLIIACLVCASLGFISVYLFLANIAQECRFQTRHIPRPIPEQTAVPLTTVSYINPMVTQQNH